MPDFGVGMLRTGGAAAPTAVPDPEDFPKWMRRTVVAGATPYPNPPIRVPGLLGAYVWAKAFEQDERNAVADLRGFYERLATANRATTVAGVTDVAGLSEAICWANEPLMFLATTSLDTGKVSCMHCADTFRSYS
eukprot:11544938-Ditylum_brightwellii.AAC.1